MAPDSLLFGENAAFVDAQYQAWLEDPASVDPQWRALFEKEPRPEGGPLPGSEPRFRPASIFAGAPAQGAAQAAADPDLALRQARVAQLINAWRVRGHMQAHLDPLGQAERRDHPELSLQWWGLSEADLDQPVSPGTLAGLPPMTTLRAILDRLRKAYGGSIGVEYMNIDHPEQKRWVRQKMESLPDERVLTPEQARKAVEKACDAEEFEQYLQRRFPGTKRFSLEGGETLIPLMDQMVEDAASLGVREIIFGMAHRGRLNVLANVMHKPVAMILQEFQDVRSESFQGSGDVKYHLGYSSDRPLPNGESIHLSLAFNPSHLEAVDPVVEGRVRAKQDRWHADGREDGPARCMPVLLHGDAAFAGQGLVGETLNLSELKGYFTGGTIHIVVNNQIGFTTSPHEARSTPYATDVARMLGIPIFHVNGEDAEAVAAVVRMAVQWRQTFKRDVIIDMYCFRKWGHNEGDEPGFTQPLLYDAIRRHPSPREVISNRLVERGLITAEEAVRLHKEARQRIEKSEAPNTHDSYLGNTQSQMGRLWARYRDAKADWTPAFDKARLRELLVAANTLPAGFNAHPKIQRLLQTRLEMARGERPLDWAMGEQAAWATLLDQGYPVRLSGQDSGRGTFSHRHATLTDVNTGEEIQLLDRVGKARFRAVDSLLSEAAVLGFEFGYTLDYPEALVMWEAQFGDFANGAQVIIDQFIASTEQKWNRFCSVVMLLPHGYEGQGPEHSSARIERYMLLCAEDNMQVANCTTPANLYHLLRRQVLRPVRKPLVIFTPKSLLRHAKAVSTLDELTQGQFQAVIPDPEVKDAKRVVLVSGKLFYELLEARKDPSVALVRVEELYPYPRAELQAVFDAHPKAEVVWCQEEPRNMGAWPVYCDWLREQLPAHRQPRYVGRKPAAAPATGSHSKHHHEQHSLIHEAVDLQS